jgi:acyl carrier protein
MTRELVLDAVRDVLGGIAPEVDLGAVDPAANLREALDIDSMDFLRLVQQLAARLHVEIPERDYPRVATLAALVAYLEERAP